MSCLDRIKAKYPSLDDKELKRLAEVFDSYKAKYEGDMATFREMSKGAIDDFQTSAMAKQRARINDTPKMVRNVEHLFQENFKGDYVEAVLSLFEGTTRNVKGKWFNIDNIYQTNKTKMTNWYLHGLRNEGLLKFASDPKNADKIIDLFENYDPEFAKSEDPFKKIVHKTKQLNANLLKMMQDAGSTITGNDRYIFSQTHNHDLIMQDIDKWIEFTAERIDPVKSFGHGEWTPEQVSKALREMANNIEDFGGWGEGNFMGGKRELYFLEGKFKEYNAEYGYRSFVEGVASSIEVATKKSAIHEIFGSDPEKNLQNLIATIKSVKKGDPNLSDRNLRKIQDALDYYKNKGKRPGYGLNPKLYGLVQGVKSYETLRVLGMSGVTALNDFANVMVSQKLATGKSFPRAFVDTIVNFLATVPPSQKAYYSELLNVGLDELPKELFEFLGYNPRNTGMFRVTHKFMILNGLDAVTSSTRKTAARVHAHDLTKTVNSSKLNDWQKQSLDFIGLSEKDVANLRTISGKDLVTPDAVRVNGPDADIVPDGFLNTAEGKRKYLNRLESKLASYYNNMVNYSSPKMGAKEQRQMFRYLPTNHPGRLAVEVLGFLQSTILKITNNQAELMRASNPKGELTNFSAVSMLAKTMVLMGTTKYAVDRLKEYMRTGEVDYGDDDKMVRDVGEALLNSGAGGIYVDFMSQVASPFRNQYGAKMPNPIIDHLSQVAQTLAKPSEKKFQHLLRRSMPAQNLWFIDNELRRNFVEFRDIHDSLGFLDK